MPNYGYPKDATSRLRELTLKGLPEPVRYVRSGHDKPALYVHGPLKEGQSVQEAPKAIPTDVHYQKGSHQVAFHFDPPLGEGEYQVVVHASRIRAEVNGQDEPMPLFEDDGSPWSGYRLTVIEDGVEAGDPDEQEPTHPAHSGGTGSSTSYDVRVGSERKPSGSHGLSGEALSVLVEGEPPETMQLQVVPLERSAAEPLYEQHLSSHVSAPTGEDGDHLYTFRSSGPIGSASWAVFHDTRTMGRMLPEKTLGSVAVMRGPTEKGGEVPFDLPLNCRLKLLADGETVWWGQTRLLPLFLSLDRHRLLEGGSTGGTGAPSKDADELVKIWRASLEALRLWGCSLPDYVPESFEQYIKARLEHGWPSGGQYTGDVRVRLGDQTFQGTLDGSLKRRLQALADNLRSCEETADLFPEDTLPAGHGRLASKAAPTFYPHKRKRPRGHRRGRRRNRGEQWQEFERREHNR